MSLKAFLPGRMLLQYASKTFWCPDLGQPCAGGMPVLNLSGGQCASLVRANARAKNVGGLKMAAMCAEVRAKYSLVAQAWGSLVRAACSC